MTRENLGFRGFGLRFGAALVLVLLTFNPSGFSYFHWLRDALPDVPPPTVLLGIALLIGWIVFLRGTMRSLGVGGVLLALAFFGVLVWAVVWRGWLTLDDTGALAWVALLVIAAVLSMGLSWSHVRRRPSGQDDVDPIDRD